MTNVYAKDNNVFLDTKFTVPLSGTSKFIEDARNETAKSPLAFFGVSLGYSIELIEDYTLEPSLGYFINTEGIIDGKNRNFNYNYYDFTLPIMYYKKGFKGGIFMRYMKIPSFEVSDFYNERAELLKDKDAYSIGLKAVTSSWFISYEYLFNGKYSSVDKLITVDIEGSRISVGLRNTF
ncbi:MAG: Unknown protein [uncultured Sulfurovum sp.]|uniref:Outer membrane protein beta-barrel domain-containing protein n=1 Tax=uncultured Sulfurovum sp. TaxID=269237 RepID=A0A6S6TFS8_9BACT|nr:MAG: Unknown protein [uncultured Sulfurovum sp.]